MHCLLKIVTTLFECTKTHNAKNWYIKHLVLLTYLKQLLVFEKCALHSLKCSHVIDSEASDLTVT